MYPTNRSPAADWFAEARYGMFVHFGLFSLLGRGEWAMNRESIPQDEYRALARTFDPRAFDAGRIADLAVEGGMKYVVFTTMHHEGFRMYDSQLTDFTSVRTSARRDFVAEMIAACRARGLKIGLYHSLNNWIDQPDAVAAYEKTADYNVFISRTHARIRELLEKYNPVDILWYDGHWPFTAEGWRAHEMDAMVRAIQPHILVNGRNGLPGDFATPEGHLGAPNPWRPWEACMTLNDSWGYHAGDQHWKCSADVVEMLATCAQYRGNLLLNIGPDPDGIVPTPSAEVIREVGDWLRRGGSEAVFGTEAFTWSLHTKGNHRGDWNHHGHLTSKGHCLYWFLRRWPGSSLVLGGVQGRLRQATLLTSHQTVSFRQDGEVVRFEGLPAAPDDPVCSLLRLEFDDIPALYQCAGHRPPRYPHPHYDPGVSDIKQH